VNDQQIVVFTAQGEVEERQVRAFLEAHQIPTTVRGEALRHTHAFVLNGLAAVEIMVTAEFEAEARRLLDEVEKGEFALSDDWSD